MKTAINVWLILLSSVSMSLSEAAEQNCTIRLGDASVILSCPKGHYRVDGRSSRLDSFLKATVGEGVRLLSWYGSEIALAEALTDKSFTLPGLNYQACIGKRLESLNITPEQFKRIKSSILKDTKPFVEDVSRERMDAAGSKAMSVIHGKASEMKVGEIVSLGVDEDAEESVSYSTLIKVHWGANSNSMQSTVIVQGVSQILVQNRLISLTSGKEYSTAADIELVRKAVRDWKNSILILNKRASSP
jgi:hypothetical protein